VVFIPPPRTNVPESQPKRRKPADQAWVDLAREFGGTVEEDKRGAIKAVRIPHGSWMLTLDRYVVSSGHSSHTYTRVRVPIRPRTPFRMRIFRDNVFFRIAKWFGMQDIASGSPDLERGFVFQSDNESALRSLLMDGRVVALLLKEKGGRLEVAALSKKERKGTDATSELRYITGGLIKDPVRLRDIIELVRTHLDGIARIMGA
jgi:hypothetical protein